MCSQLVGTFVQQAESDICIATDNLGKPMARQMFKEAVVPISC